MFYWLHLAFMSQFMTEKIFHTLSLKHIKHIFCLSKTDINFEILSNNGKSLEMSFQR